MRILVAFVASLGLSPTGVGAEGWQHLQGEDITTALAARVLGYPDGTLQDFFADGRTLYGETYGRWEVRGDLYCSLWPPSDRWTCYRVDRNRLDVRFTDDDGAETIGRYVDLQ
jgi:hypothetical protein